MERSEQIGIHLRAHGLDREAEGVEQSRKTSRCLARAR